MLTKTLDNGITVSVERRRHLMSIMIYYRDLKGYCTELSPREFNIGGFDGHWSGVQGQGLSIQDVSQLEAQLINIKEGDVRDVVYTKRKKYGYLDK